MNLRIALAEFFGTAFLLAIVVGSGVMGERLAAGNMAIALLANAIATGAGLYVLISALAPVSGAHLNPAVSVLMTLRGELRRRDLPVYVAMQIAGGWIGVLAAHAMFALPLLQWSSKARAGAPQMLSEFVATLGLLATILLLSRQQSARLPAAVAAYITSAYWFTASTSFANPAVTLARACTDTFAGIRPADVMGFIAAQLAAALLCFVVARGFSARRCSAPP